MDKNNVNKREIITPIKKTDNPITQGFFKYKFKIASIPEIKAAIIEELKART